MVREVVVELWTGAIVVARLGPGDPEPTPAELDAWAVTFIPQNDGIRPTVRVLERCGFPVGRGPAGGVTR